MYDSIDELLTKLGLVEDSTIEWKEVRVPGDKVNAPARDDLADELASFANWCDGVVVLGIQDKPREVIGIPREKLAIVEQFVRDVCNDTIKPMLPVRVVAMELPDKTGERRAILKVDVPRSLFVHASPGGYFFRQSGQKKQMPPELLARVFQQRSQARLIRFDEQVVPETTPASFDPILVKRFVRTGEKVEDALAKLAFARVDDRGEVRATVSGVLFCTERPTDWLRNAYIDAVAYRGTERSPSYQHDAKTFDGPLDRQIEQAFRFCQLYNRVRAIKSPARREVPQFSAAALFEAIVNAVAHRDYSIAVSHIRIFMFDDRVEIYSPGGLPNTMTVDSMELRQANRNENIVSVLARCPVPRTDHDLRRQFLMDKRGWGVPAILDESLKLSGRRPVYRVVDESEVILTIFAAPEPDFEAQ
ncbi:MAG: putative DNA binding domain-containing protein [Candidatus Sumerlaeia bacterium]|nr:putative DNA binding domain-containing protein [Candidatus Sumerlaeia bacterium]